MRALCGRLGPTLKSSTEAVKTTMMSWQPTTLCATSGQNCGGGQRRRLRAPVPSSHQPRTAAATAGWPGRMGGSGKTGARTASAPPPAQAHLAAALVLPLVDVERLVAPHSPQAHKVEQAKREDEG